MLTVKANTALVGISELRTNFAKVLDALGKYKVLLGKRNKPIAVIVPIKKYQEMEELVELIEDMGLGYLARERHKNSKPSDYLDLDKVEKRLKIKSRKRIVRSSAYRRVDFR